MKKVDYAELKKSEKFTPALYHEKGRNLGRRQHKPVFAGNDI